MTQELRQATKVALKRLEDKYFVHDLTIRDLLDEAIDIKDFNDFMRAKTLDTLDHSILEENEYYRVDDYEFNFARECIILRFTNLVNSIAFSVARDNNMHDEDLISIAFIAMTTRIDKMIERKKVDTKRIMQKCVKSACIRHARKVLSKDSKNVTKLVYVSSKNTSDESNDQIDMLDHFSFDLIQSERSVYDKIYK